MATSGSKVVSVTKYNNLVFEWQAGEPNQTFKETPVSWRLLLVALPGGGFINATAPKKWKVVIDGSPTTGTSNVSIGVNEVKVLALGSTWVFHNPDGTKTFSFSFEQEFNITFSGSKIGTVSGGGTATLPPIEAFMAKATITSAENLTDESNPRIYYSNPSGEKVDALEACISFTGSKADIPYKPISKTGTEYIFNLSEEERETLRNGCIDANERSIRFYVRTTIDGKQYTSYIVRTLTIVNATPSFSTTFLDEEAEYLAQFVGSYNAYVRYFSKPVIKVSPTLKKGATFSHMEVKHGERKYTSQTTTLYIPQKELENGSFEVIVYDSRGNKKTNTYTRNFVDYLPITVSAKVESNGAGEATLSVNGDVYNGSFGAVNNTLAVEYGYALYGEDVTNWTQSTITIAEVSGNSYSFIEQFELDYKNTYDFHVRVRDRMTSDETYYRISMEPIFDWSKEDFEFKVPVVINNKINFKGFGWINHEDYRNKVGIELGEGTNIISANGAEYNFIDDLYIGDADNVDDLHIDATNSINLNATKVFINNCRAGAQNIIHNDTGRFMTGSQSFSLAGESMLSRQLNGLILCWSKYDGGKVDEDFIYTYLPKRMTSISDEIVMPFVTKSGVMGVKVLHYESVDDLEDKFIGDDINSNGNNRAVCLRYVMGY